MKKGFFRWLVFFVLLVVFVSCIVVRFPVTHASLISNIRKEAPATPPNMPIVDDPIDPIDIDPPQVQREETEYVIHYRGISGRVYEEIGDSFHEYEIKEGVNVKDLNDARIAIPGVIVEAGEYKQITDEKGQYHFENLPAGEYTLKFTYGKLENNEYAKDEASQRKVLKYNGHDYITTTVPGGEEYPHKTTRELEITTSGKGCEQIILAVDCSGSVRSEKITVNGVKMTRLEAIIDAAKKLVHSLLTSGENIYIGIVLFSGQTVRVQSLTNNEEILVKHLEYIPQNGFCISGTDLYSALGKAEESFVEVKGESNRHVVIMSDGIPTRINWTQLFGTESEEQIYETLETIKNTTREKIDDLTEKGIHVKSVYLDSEDEEEATFIKELFEGAVDYFSVINGEQFAKEITNNVKQDLVESTREKEYQETITIPVGLENSERRKTVDSNYHDIFYYNTETGVRTKIFEQIEKEYAYDEEQANQLSQSTYMEVYGGTYRIDEPTDGVTEKILIGDPSDYESEEDYCYRYIHHVNSEYSGCDVGLTGRPALNLKLDMTLTGEKAMTSKGILLSEQRRDIGSVTPILQPIDDELVLGAQIDLEYSIKVSNISALQCNQLSLISYLPKLFTLEENKAFITEVGNNEKYHWKEYTTEELRDRGFITEETYQLHKDQRAMVATMENDGTESGFYIPPGGSRTIKVVVSTLMGGDISILDDTIFVIDAEILSYADNGENVHRRMASTATRNLSNGYSLAYLQGIFQGNSKEQDYTITTNDIYIQPPLGEEKNYTTIWVSVLLGVVVIATFIAYCFFDKKQN